MLATRRIDPLPKRRQARRGIAEEHFAKRGQRQTTPAAIKELPAQEAFQFLDGLGRRRLADIERLGRPGHGPEARHFEKAGDVAEPDAGVDNALRHGVRLSLSRKSDWIDPPMGNLDNPGIMRC
jgi:hypothetical protein